MNSVQIGNTSSKDSIEADKIFRALEGKTYMNFHVGFAPIGGSFDIWVESKYDCSESEFKDFVLFYLTTIVMVV